MIAAIGTDGTRPVVWGVGETPDAAMADAEAQDADWDSGGWDTCEILAWTAGRIRAGTVDCGDLGIRVTMRGGDIWSASELADVDESTAVVRREAERLLLLAELSTIVHDDGTDQLRVIVDHAKPGQTSEDLAAIVREAREDARIEREREAQER